jgi:putative membrane protein
MMWYGHGLTGLGWALMTGGTLVFWALLVGAVVLLVRTLGRHADTGGATNPPPADGASNAEHLLAERFARGEIDEAEYTQRLAVLRGASGPDVRHGHGR